MHIDTLKFYKYKPTQKRQYIGKFCQVPYHMIQIDKDGDVMLCSCEEYMPYVIGNVYKQSIQDIWLGEIASRVRQSVYQGHFTYCNWSCSFLHNLLPQPAEEPAVPLFPTHIKLDFDLSCNLKCPTCRESVIIEKYNKKINKQIEIFDEIKQFAMSNPSHVITLFPLTSGEVFASHSGLNFLKSLIGYSNNNLKIHATTNGTLIRKNHDLVNQLSNVITNWSVSIDAVTPETYQKVRGGDWDDLIEGLKIIKNLSPRYFSVNFCIQEKNYHEIEAFADWAQELGALVSYQRMSDWGHWNTDWWKQNNVIDRTRPEFKQVLNSLRSVQNKYPNKIGIDGSIVQYLNKESP